MASVVLVENDFELMFPEKVNMMASVVLMENDF